jgi:hypothetical protein
VSTEPFSATAQAAWVAELVAAERAAFAQAAREAADLEAVNRARNVSRAGRAMSVVGWWLPELAGAGVLTLAAVGLASAGLAAPAWVVAVLAVALLAAVVGAQLVLLARNRRIWEVRWRELVDQADEPDDELVDQADDDAGADTGQEVA